MAPRYYRPTLVLPPESEKQIFDHAHAAGVGVQDFMRDAVLRAISPAPATPPAAVVPSLEAIQLQLRSAAAALANIAVLLDAGETNEQDKTIDWAPARGHASAASGHRVVGDILRSVEGLISGPGKGDIGPLAIDRGPEKAADGTRRKGRKPTGEKAE